MKSFLLVSSPFSAGKNKLEQEHAWSNQTPSSEVMGDLDQEIKDQEEMIDG